MLYKAKQYEIEAVQFTDFQESTLAKIRALSVDCITARFNPPTLAVFDMLGKSTVVRIGDYVVRDRYRNTLVYKASAFEKLYEPVKEDEHDTKDIESV